MTAQIHPRASLNRSCRTCRASNLLVEYAELKTALDDSVKLINDIVAYVCNTMVSENAVAYVTVSESDANAQSLVSKAVRV